MSRNGHPSPKRIRGCVLVSAATLGLLVVILGSASMSYAGLPPDVVLTGKVRDAFQESPVPGAEITVDGLPIWAALGTDGSFTLRGLPSGIVILRVRAAGFEPLTLRIELILPVTSVDVWLQPLTTSLETMVVTATRTEKTLKEVPILTEVISRRDLEFSGAITAQDALNDLSCIQFAPDSHGANILMNGLGPRYVLLLVDGERIAGEVQGNIDFSRLNASSIERIEVVKGAASSLYGSNAIGGVVNIITRNVRHPLEVDLDSRFSRYREAVWSGAVGLKKDWLSSRTEAVYKSSDGYDLNPSTIARTVEEYEDFSVGQKFGISFTDRLSLNLKGNYYQRERFDAARVYTNVHHKYYSRSYGMSTSYQLREHDCLDISWHSDNYETRNVVAPPIDEERSTYEQDRNTVRLNGSFALHKKHQLTIGGEYDQERLFSKRVTDEKQNAHAWNCYAQDDLFLSEAWNIVSGARLDNHSEYGSHLSPKVTAMYQVLPLTFRASFGTGFRAPTLKELYLNWDHGGGGPFVYGNPDLDPEHSRHGSLSVEYQRMMWNGSITVFRNDLTDMIDTRQSDTDPNVYFYFNVDEAFTQGIDFLAGFELGSGFSLSGGYTYLDTEDKTTGKELFGRPRHSANTKLAYDNTDLGIHVNLRGKWVSQKLIYTEEDQNTGENVEHRQNAHGLWDVSIDKKVFGKASIHGGVDNLFDYLDRDYLVTPGRRIYGGFRIRYN